MASEIYYLSYLAFKGLEGEQIQIEFNVDELDKYHQELEAEDPQGRRCQEFCVQEVI